MYRWLLLVTTHSITQNYKDKFMKGIDSLVSCLILGSEK